MIQKIGSKAFRRPIVADEAADLLAIFKNARQTVKASFADSVSAVLQGILQSPNFLYHRERGSDHAGMEAGAVKLTNYELASRLSYFLTGTMPDDALLAVAAAGQLVDPTQLEQQARRLAAAQTPAVAESVADFLRQWLSLDTAKLEKGKDAYPDFVNLRPLLADELLHSAQDYVKAGATIATLFTDPSVYVNNVSAKTYGVASPSSDTLVKVAGNPKERAGIFTQLAFLSVNATASGSHPIKRGKILFERVLCGIMPPPPPDVPPASAPQPNQTTRERFAMHGANPCASCHKVMDPLGFAFEHYDGEGGYRAMEAGKPVDSTGSITLPSGAPVTFVDAVDLLRQLATSPDATTCIARHLGRYGTGITSDDDQPVADELLSLAGAEHKLVDLFVSVTHTKAFRLRTISEGEVLP